MRLCFWCKWLWPNMFWPIRYLLPYNLLFHNPSVIHDYQYRIGGNKEQSDLMFYKMCLAISKNNLQKFFAWLYFILVKYLWFMFYKW